MTICIASPESKSYSKVDSVKVDGVLFCDIGDDWVSCYVGVVVGLELDKLKDSVIEHC